MRPSFLVLIACALVVPMSARNVRAAADDAKTRGEDEKIKALIGIVRDLKDATFIRNGDEYDCKAAAEHMERKWKAGRKDIKTARDFIKLAASKSSRSGKPYRIRFKDGTEQTSEAFLTAELEKLEGKADGDEKPAARRRAA